MTENKRFTFSEDIGCLDVPCSNISDNGKFLGTALLSDVEQLCDKLNAFQELSINDLKRIEELEKENNHLKYQLGDREEAFEVYASEIHDKITTLIDKKIKELQYKDKVCLIPRESITVLEELKRELRL